MALFGRSAFDAGLTNVAARRVRAHEASEDSEPTIPCRITKGESGDCLTRCSAVLSNLPGSILQSGGLDVRNEGSVTRKLSCDGDAWRGLCCARGRPGRCVSGVVTMDARTVNARYEEAVMSRRSSRVSEAGCAVCMRKWGGSTYHQRAHSRRGCRRRQVSQRPRLHLGHRICDLQWLSPRAYGSQVTN